VEKDLQLWGSCESSPPCSVSAKYWGKNCSEWQCACYSELQWGAVRCSDVQWVAVLQCGAMSWHGCMLLLRQKLQWVVVCMLQWVVVSCSELQWGAASCSKLTRVKRHWHRSWSAWLCCSELQGVAVSCRVLQWVEMRCSELKQMQFTEVEIIPSACLPCRHIALQWVAGSYGELHCDAAQICWGRNCSECVFALLAYCVAVSCSA